MLIYVIPFILLLVVLVVLKKREATKSAEPTDKKASSAKSKTKQKAKGKNKNANDESEDISATEQSVAIQQTSSTPIPEELRRKIENLIRHQNYFAAEAQINQALNKDASQHDLYLMLLELHLLQNDEFAIKQLLAHIESLGLDQISFQAQQKCESFEQEQIAAKEAAELERKKVTDQAFQSLTSTAPKPTADFDSLSHKPSAEAVFDHLIQPSHTPEPENKSIDFDFSTPPSAAKASENTPPPLEFKLETPEPQSSAPSLDFKLEPENQTPPPLKMELDADSQSTQAIVPNQDIAPLEFKLEPIVKTEPEPEVTIPSAAPSLDFDFKLDTKTQAVDDVAPQLIEEAKAPTLEFNIEPQATEAPILKDLDSALETIEAKPQSSASDSLPTLDFNFEPSLGSQQDLTSAKAIEEPEPTLDLEIAPEVVPQAEELTHQDLSNLDFNIEPQVYSQSEKIVQEDFKVETQESIQDPEEVKLDFDFKFDQTTQVASQEKEVAHVAEQPTEIEIDFNSLSLDTAIKAPSENAELHPASLDFELKNKPEILEKAAEPVPAPVQEIVPLDFSFSLDGPETQHPYHDASKDNGFKLAPSEAVAAAEISSDPLERAFPELAQLNEIDLNLELAEQYINLGAYEAARSILAENESEYSAQQQEIVNQLRTKLAS